MRAGGAESQAGTGCFSAFLGLETWQMDACSLITCSAITGMRLRACLCSISKFIEIGNLNLGWLYRETIPGNLLAEQ